MKRMIHSLLAAAILVSAMTCTAFAATTDYTTDIDGTVNCTNPDGNADTFTASYGSAVAGNQYVVLVVKGESGNYNAAKAENILYIDQKAADSSTIEFDVKPMAVDNSVVLLGGTFADGQSPKELGTLIKQIPPYVLGDIDNDGLFTVLDAIATLRMAAGVAGDGEYTEAQLAAADMDGDGLYTVLDAIAVLRLAAGLA